MSRVPGSGVRNHELPQPIRIRSAFDRIPRVANAHHPIDITVDRRVSDRTRRKWIIKLQDRVLDALGTDAGLYLKLETLLDERQREREKCYFNLGYEHGAAETHALACAASPRAPLRIGAVAKQLQEVLVQAELTADESMLALLECAWAATRPSNCR